MGNHELHFNAYDNINIAEIEARAHRMRAEALAEMGKSISAWLKSFNIGFAARTAH